MASHHSCASSHGHFENCQSIARVFEREQAGRGVEATEKAQVSEDGHGKFEATEKAQVS